MAAIRSVARMSSPTSIKPRASALAAPRPSSLAPSGTCCVDGMADAAEREDVHGVVEHSERFHRAIVEGSGNQLLYTMWSSLSITDHTALTMVTLSLDLGTLAESHQPIVDAIAAGDVELACRVSREHQDWFVEMLEATASRGASGDVATGSAPQEGAGVAEPAPVPSA